jgi:hypothetical protein
MCDASWNVCVLNLGEITAEGPEAFAWLGTNF